MAEGLSWKSYQENLPLAGADLVNYSDGIYSNLTDFAKILPAQTPALTSAGIVAQYAAKHNPFVYFRSVQEGWYRDSSLKNTVDFENANGLFADLSSGHIPTYSFIAPNQCNDQHGRGNAGPFCAFDPTDNGTQAGLNPALIYAGDVTVQRLVTAIHKSPVWKDGRSAIVVVWDENDYSTAPETNQVLTGYYCGGMEQQLQLMVFGWEVGLVYDALLHCCWVCGGDGVEVDRDGRAEPGVVLC